MKSSLPMTQLVIASCCAGRKLWPKSTPVISVWKRQPYSQGIALFLVEKEQLVSVINPARIKYFGLAQNQGNKTDKADARLIAQYCQMQSPPPWRIAAPEVRLLQEMVRRLHALSDLAAQEKNRAQAPGQSKTMMASSKRVVAALEKELLRLKREVRALVKAHEDLCRDSKLLQSVPGVGEITSWDILAEMPDVEEFDSAQSVAAYAGLAPREQRSGSSVRKVTTLSKRGNSRLRKAFYFPAVSAMQWNPLVKAHYQRLRDKGKPKMVALAACMRKLLMICFGVLKHQKPFDAEWLLQPVAQT
jgi:transposase